MKIFKNNLSERMKNFDRDKFKLRLKRAGLVMTVGAVGYLGYKFGVAKTELEQRVGFYALFKDNPGLEETFQEAVDNTMKKTSN